MSAILEPTPQYFRHPVARYFAATRPAFLLASLVAGLLGLATASHHDALRSVPLALLTLIGALCAHAGANVLNDYYDALNGTDARNSERLFPFTGGSRFIQNGVLTLAQTRNFGYALLVTVVLVGLLLLQYSASDLLVLGVAGLFVGWAYSATPLKLNSRGLGELCIAVGFLLIVVGADFVQRASFAALPWLAGMPYALLATNLLYINQFPDRAADAASGKRHWVARLKVRRARWGYALLALLAYAVLVMLVVPGILPAVALVGLLAAPLSFVAARQLLRYADEPRQLVGAIKLTIAAMLIHGVALLLALLFFKGVS